MKKLLQLLVLAVLAFAGGTWFGRSTTPKPRILIQGELTTVSCGGGHYTAEEFERINEEIPGKLDDLLGEHQHDDYLVTVTPFVSGYRLRMAGLAKAPLWDHGIQKDLRNWVMNRMDAIQLETPSRAVQSGAGQPDTKPADKTPAEVQPPLPNGK